MLHAPAVGTVVDLGKKLELVASLTHLKRQADVPSLLAMAKRVVAELDSVCGRRKLRHVFAVWREDDLIAQFEGAFCLGKCDLPHLVREDTPDRAVRTLSRKPHGTTASDAELSGRVLQHDLLGRGCLGRRSYCCKNGHICRYRQDAGDSHHSLSHVEFLA